MERAALLVAVLSSGCVHWGGDGDGDGPGGEADTEGSASGGMADEGLDETGDGGADGGADGGSAPAGQECHEYAPGEAGGADYTPLFTEAQLEGLDLTIDYPDTPFAALDTAATYLVEPGIVRATFTGLVQIDHDNPSTALEFNDVPMTDLDGDNFTVTLDGEETSPEAVTCTSDGQTPITVIFAVDVTGSMAPAIAAVRDSLNDFVDAAVGLGIQGKIGVVTYQDTVGVNIPFDDCSGVEGLIPERSPFFTPVALDDLAQVDALRDFIGNLNADGGADLPENLAAAVDFATHNVIGYAADGSPNVIGEGDDDPPYTEPWPIDELEGLTVVIGITDATFHGDGTSSPSLWPEFRPRDVPEIISGLGSTVVSIVDPAFQDGELDISASPGDLDADLWSRYTGGFGQDWFLVDAFLFTESISFFDLELLLMGRGLLEIPLAPALAATCVVEVQADAAPSEMGVLISHEIGAIQYSLAPAVVSL